jgi:uncharacterized membrane protein YtjA (UPF0391 family)
VLDSISQYSPVVIINGLAAILFMIGYVPFGVAMIRTPTLPRWAQSWLLWALRSILLGFGGRSGFYRRVADRDLGQCECRGLAPDPSGSGRPPAG